MSKSVSRIVRGISLAVLIAATPVLAQTATDPSAVVATVGGEPITEAELSFAAEDMAQDLAQMPAEERRAFLVRVMIDMKVMSRAAREAGMDKSDVFAQRQKYLEDRALRRAYFNEVIIGGVTEEAARAEYDAYVAQYQPQDEVRASHILVESEDEAKAIKARIDAGEDFAALARENSIDPGAANGGDLGFFGRGMMVPPFEQAAFALANAGDVSEPVQSQFGWHIIKLAEKRKSSPPTFEQLAGQIQNQLMMESFTTNVDALMDGVEIDIADPELKARFDAQEAAESATE